MILGPRGQPRTYPGIDRLQFMQGSIRRDDDMRGDEPLLLSDLDRPGDQKRFSRTILTANEFAVRMPGGHVLELGPDHLLLGRKTDREPCESRLRHRSPAKRIDDPYALQFPVTVSVMFRHSRTPRRVRRRRVSQSARSHARPVSPASSSRSRRPAWSRERREDPSPLLRDALLRK